MPYETEIEEKREMEKKLEKFNFHILYFVRNGNEYRELLCCDTYFRINGGKRHEDLPTYLETITLKGWKQTDLHGYLKVKYHGKE